jgi:hypothetical protein
VNAKRKPMSMRQAQAVADQLWGGPGVCALIRRGRKSPRFNVGYVCLNGTAYPVSMATSDVDWESAFMSLAESGKAQLDEVMDAFVSAGAFGELPSDRARRTADQGKG